MAELSQSYERKPKKLLTYIIFYAILQMNVKVQLFHSAGNIHILYLYKDVQSAILGCEKFTLINVHFVFVL